MEPEISAALRLRLGLKLTNRAQRSISTQPALSSGSGFLIPFGSSLGFRNPELSVAADASRDCQGMIKPESAGTGDSQAVWTLRKASIRSQAWFAQATS